MKVLALNSFGEEVPLTVSELITCKQALEIESGEFTTLFFEDLSRANIMYVAVSNDDEVTRSYLIQVLKKKFGGKILYDEYN